MIPTLNLESCLRILVMVYSQMSLRCIIAGILFEFEILFKILYFAWKEIQNMS